MQDSTKFDQKDIDDFTDQFKENEAPKFSETQADRVFEVNQEFEIPLITFTDDLTPTAELSITVFDNKDTRSLPDFLRFQEALNKLTGKAMLDAVLVDKFKDKGDFTVDHTIYINASDGYYSNETSFKISIRNRAPILGPGLLPTQSKHVNVKFDFTISADIIVDPDVNDELIFLASYDQTSITSLEWLQYSEETRRFGGTPSTDFFLNCTFDLLDHRSNVLITNAEQISFIKDMCQYEIIMIGYDGLTTFNRTFNISVENHRPKVNKSIYDDPKNLSWAYEVHITQTMDYIFPVDSFMDNDPEDTLYYTAEIVQNPSETKWPGWLNFNDQMRKFSGTPVQEDLYNMSLCKNFTFTEVNQKDAFGQNYTLRKDMCTYVFNITANDTYQKIYQFFGIIIYNYIPYSYKSFYINDTLPNISEIFEF